MRTVPHPIMKKYYLYKICQEFIYCRKSHKRFYHLYSLTNISTSENKADSPKDLQYYTGQSFKQQDVLWNRKAVHTFCLQRMLMLSQLDSRILNWIIFWIHFLTEYSFWKLVSAWHKKKKSMKTLLSLTRNEFHSSCTSAGPTVWTSTAANCCCFILFYTSSNFSQQNTYKCLKDHQIMQNNSQHKQCPISPTCTILNAGKYLIKEKYKSWNCQWALQWSSNTDCSEKAPLQSSDYQG